LRVGRAVVDLLFGLPPEAAVLVDAYVARAGCALVTLGAAQRSLADADVPHAQADRCAAVGGLGTLVAVRDAVLFTERVLRRVDRRTRQERHRAVRRHLVPHNRQSRRLERALRRLLDVMALLLAARRRAARSQDDEDANRDQGEQHSSH